MHLKISRSYQQRAAGAYSQSDRVTISNFVTFLAIFFVACLVPLQSQQVDPHQTRTIADLMDKHHIPGLSVIIAGKVGTTEIRDFGYSDVKKNIPVGKETLFPLTSIADGIIAIGVLQLERAGTIDLDKPLNEYVDGFQANFRGGNLPVTIRQLLNHTSGLRAGLTTGHAGGRYKLAFRPGEKYRYNRLNIDLLAEMISTVSEMTAEEYLSQNVLAPLGMDRTFWSSSPEGENRAVCYKIGFGTPRRFQIPKGAINRISCLGFTDAADVGRLLSLYINDGAGKWSQFHSLANSQIYAMGLYYTKGRDGRFAHSGQNPNAGSFIGFDLQKGVGVAVLANSNSPGVQMIGEMVLNHISGNKEPYRVATAKDLDGTFSAAVWVFGVLSLLLLAYLGMIVFDLITGRRKFARLSALRYLGLLAAPVLAIPYIFAVYLLPGALIGLPWSMAAVWMPVSFAVMVKILAVVMILSYLAHILTSQFPNVNRYFDVIPPAILLSLLAGAANATVLFIVSNSIGQYDLFYYYFYYFSLAFITYISCNKLVRTRLIKLSIDIICRLRLQLVGRIFSTTFQRFEEVDRGRVYSTLNYDVENIGNTTLTIINLITNVITLLAIFIFLATISVWAVLFLTLVISGLLLLYYRTNKNARMFFEEARTTRDGYMQLIDGLLNGFKELKLHRAKESEYKEDIEDISDEFRKKLVVARIKYVNANLVAQSFLIVSLGTMSFGFPQVFPGIDPVVIISFIMAILYLMGPINFILTSMPAILQMRVSWKRIQDFLRDIPETALALNGQDRELSVPAIESITLRDLTFSYKNGDGDSWFTVGPLNFEAKKGELVFIIGGNGSGKTTLAKLLTGLYQPDQGQILVNGEAVEPSRLGELYSVVFSDFYLFEKIYNLNGNEAAEIDQYLRMLQLHEKVEIKKKRYSTIKLSHGQRKRLALLQCFLESRPVYLFDEWAADQDPQFRRFFYRELLASMKEEGKIVFAVTHDDHYFDIADKIIKMDMGQFEFIKKNN